MRKLTDSSRRFLLWRSHVRLPPLGQHAHYPPAMSLPDATLPERAVLPCVSSGRPRWRVGRAASRPPSLLPAVVPHVCPDPRAPQPLAPALSSPCPSPHPPTSPSHLLLLPPCPLQEAELEDVQGQLAELEAAMFAAASGQLVQGKMAVVRRRPPAAQSPTAPLDCLSAMKHPEHMWRPGAPLPRLCTPPPTRLLQASPQLVPPRLGSLLASCASAPDV